ncbi:MAG: MFS transporter [Pseudomonadota bacterium]
MTDTSAPAEEAIRENAAQAVETEATGGALGSKGLGWALFEWARNPYYNVVVIYIFTPYFTAYVIGDSVRGQTLVSILIAIAGVIMAFITPVLGSILDKAGPKKPFVFLSLATLSACAISLGLVTPSLPFAVPIGMAILIVGYCAYTISEMLHNAMLPGAARTGSLPMVSGLGLALGNAAATIVLLIIVFVSPGTQGADDLAAPVNFLGMTDEDIGRYSAPVVGIWLLFFMPLFFWLMPDVYKKGATWAQALRDFRNPKNRVQPYDWVKKRFVEYPNVMRYLVGRMIYADGIAALLTIGGVYVSGVLQWDGQQLAIYAILAGVFAVLGGFFGGFLDRLLGPKRALIFELTSAILVGIFQISVTPDAILFGLIPAGHEVISSGPFRTLSDVVYLAAVIPGAIFLVATISSSRYMLLHIAPKEKVGEFFGFYAMAGSVTVWLGPGSVAIVTWLSGDQRIGFAPVVVLLTIGLLILLTVKADKTPEHMKSA